ncbi:hypothetical protein HMI56_003457 [Coelomomyces lativittatus]|nr:hypothetical protein HMI56_003457 [Coelomomyces lativittatus]
MFLMAVFPLVIVPTLTSFSAPKEVPLGLQDGGDLPRYNFGDKDFLSFDKLQVPFDKAIVHPCEAIPALLGYIASSLDFPQELNQRPMDNFLSAIKKTNQTLIDIFQTFEVHPFLFGSIMNEKTHLLIIEHRGELETYLKGQQSKIHQILVSDLCTCTMQTCTFSQENPQLKELSYTDLLIQHVTKTLKAKPTYWSKVGMQRCDTPNHILCELQKIKAAQRNSLSSPSSPAIVNQDPSKLNKNGDELVLSSIDTPTSTGVLTLHAGGPFSFLSVLLTYFIFF